MFSIIKIIYSSKCLEIYKQFGVFRNYIDDKWKHGKLHQYEHNFESLKG